MFFMKLLFPFPFTFKSLLINDVLDPFSDESFPYEASSSCRCRGSGADAFPIRPGIDSMDVFLTGQLLSKTNMVDRGCTRVYCIVVALPFIRVQYGSPARSWIETLRCSFYCGWGFCHDEVDHNGRMRIVLFVANGLFLKTRRVRKTTQDIRTYVTPSSRSNHHHVNTISKVSSDLLRDVIHITVVGREPKVFRIVLGQIWATLEKKKKM